MTEQELTKVLKRIDGIVLHSSGIDGQLRDMYKLAVKVLNAIVEKHLIPSDTPEHKSIMWLFDFLKFQARCDNELDTDR